MQPVPTVSSRRGGAGPVSRVDVLLDLLPVLVEAGVQTAHSPDALLSRVLSHPARPDDLGPLARIEVEELSSRTLQLAFARRVDEAMSCAAALQVRATTALAGAEPSGDYTAEVAAETEIGLARAISPTRAGLDIELARTLTATFPEYLTALELGRTTVAHCRRLVEATRMVTDPTALDVIGRKALTAACRLTPGRFADRLDGLIAEHDPDALARMNRALETSRDCTVQRTRDGMGRLVYVDSWVKVNAVGARIRAAGRATQRHRRNPAHEPSRPRTPRAGRLRPAGSGASRDSVRNRSSQARVRRSRRSPAR
jgi:hypothetical protein